MKASLIIYILSALIIVCVSGLIYMLWSNRLDAPKSASTGSYVITGTWWPWLFYGLNAFNGLGALAVIAIVFTSGTQTGRRYF